MTEQEIIKFCEGYSILDYTINPDGSVDVNGSVDLGDEGFFELPFRFGKVSGDFYCNHNYLKSLENAPVFVGGDFTCSFNKLTSLEHSHVTVGGGFYCNNNQITSFGVNCISIGGEFDCSGNKLTSLDGIPVGFSHIVCGKNNLNIESFYNLFELGYADDEVLLTDGTWSIAGEEIEEEFDLVALRRGWIINSILNE